MRKAQQPPVVDLTAEDDISEEPNRMEAHLESDDYFEVLNLPRSASASDVKRAYRKLAVQWHPDKNRSNLRAEEIFKRIGEAYEVLSDPKKRKIYTEYGKAGLNGGPGASDPNDRFGHRHHGNFSSQHARDIFDAFFGGQDPFEAFFGQRRGSTKRNGRFDDDFFGSMGFGGMGMGREFGHMGMPMMGLGRGFGNMGMDSFFSDEFTTMNGSGTTFSTSSSSSSSTFTDRNGHVITQKTITTTGADGQTKTTTEEYRDGTLVNSSSTCGNRLADAGRKQLEGGNRHGSRPKY
ncbi:Molecular chaperone (DnaJ superfamily) [Plasmopara halstedii]|uniref:Molecular chaperone (DnaJ superfamily) n=1 Tax=Plasmopara halstedii TaxID=4781 RepID=A0A0P1AY55_PLAHL|nr:Molecular chaperone (DnaJ superfamily) [Plasmopara halstedii]CEG47384.1 Molecular chaperone (DnaJ superfamily) [Plasmopara halstedii]|eukprot:XP_024583753.1 Molecular chaperone (DnaJ superfamily) [Plasmopara halstedii]